MGIDPHEFFDAVWEIVNEEAQSVLTMAWDGGFPGNSGAVWINEWKGLYFIASSDYEPSGPYSNLEEALDEECFSVETSRPELYSEVVPLKRLKQLAKGLVSEEDGSIRINHERFTLRKGRLYLSQ